MATMKVKDRNSRTLSRLEEQLKSGVKVGTGKDPQTLPLEERDIKRIKKEIDILKTRI